MDGQRNNPGTAPSPDSGAQPGTPPSPGAQPGPANGARKGEGPLRRFSQEVRAQIFHNTGYLALDGFTLFWLFTAGSVFGLAVETAYHFIVFGGLQSRAGLLWGPFSPIYGTGAVVLTLFLNRYYHSHNIVIFLLSMLVGSAIEFATSWGMELLWGAVAWDYTGTFGSISGRTNFFFGMMWGMLGLFWARFVIPLVKRVFSHINAKNAAVRAATVALSVFMAVNIVCTCAALGRESERAAGIPATNPVQQACDRFFPSSFMEAHFANMTVTGKGEG